MGKYRGRTIDGMQYEYLNERKHINMEERMVLQMKNIKRSTNERIRAFAKKMGWSMDTALAYMVGLAEKKNK